MKSNNQFILKERVIDNHGRVIEQRFGNGSITSYEYHENWVESANRISNIATGINSSGQTFLANLQNFSYEYDAVGNISQIKDNDEVLNFSYDALNRLTSVGGAYNENYSYNPTTGNLQSKTGIDGEYHYGTSVTRPHAVTGYGNNHNVFEYDANGQMIKRYGQNITYDVQGNLISYNGDSHVYDGDGNRVMTERGDGSVSVYIGDYYEKFFDSIGIVDPVDPPMISIMGQNYRNYLPVIHNGEGANFETISGQSYYYVGSSRIATKTEKGNYIWIYGDHLGSTSVTADKNGNELSRTSYYAWGTTRSSTGNQETDYGYTGQMQVGDIYYYNARWYDPALGRFLQADTIVPSHQGTQGFDRYAYVNNNPMRYTDPSGHWFRNTNLMMHDGGGWIKTRSLQETPPLPENLIEKYFLPELMANAKNYGNVNISVSAQKWYYLYTRDTLIKLQMFYELKFIMDSLPKIGSLDMKPDLSELYFQGFTHDNEKFSIEGEYEVFYDTWGNMQYGFIAAKLGWDMDYALEGAGKAQYYYDYFFGNEDPRIQNKNGTGFARYDDPADQAGIKAGYMLFQTCGMSCTKNDVLNILGQFDEINKRSHP